MVKAPSLSGRRLQDQQFCGAYNDMLTVLKLLGEGCTQSCIAARFPLARIGEAHELLTNALNLVGRMAVLPWAQPGAQPL